MRILGLQNLMRKYHYIFIFLLIASIASSCSLKRYDYCQIAVGRETKIKKAGALQDHPKPIAFKKKNKARSVQSPAANCDEITFFKPSVAPTFQSYNSPHFHLVHHGYCNYLRGPPALT
jgi:hypothetical protein